MWEVRNVGGDITSYHLTLMGQAGGATMRTTHGGTDGSPQSTHASCGGVHAHHAPAPVATACDPMPLPLPAAVAHCLQVLVKRVSSRIGMQRLTFQP